VAQTVADLTRADTVSLAFGDRTDAAASARSRRWSLAALSRQIEDVAQVGGRAARYQFLMMTLAPGSGRGIAGVPEMPPPEPRREIGTYVRFYGAHPRRNLFGRWQRFPPRIWRVSAASRTVREGVVRGHFLSRLWAPGYQVRIAPRIYATSSVDRKSAAGPGPTQPS
jgi:hypothetical protein